jgi:hypothetical protein
MVAVRGADASDRKVKVTGIYSDLAYNQEGGDVLGTELFIVLSRQGYYVLFQSSEGEPSVPVLVKAKVSGSSITFELPSEADPRGEFVGKITNDEVIGSFKANGQTIHLKRKNSYWQ